jgi:hypothetical protein
MIMILMMALMGGAGCCLLMSVMYAMMQSSGSLSGQTTNPPADMASTDAGDSGSSETDGAENCYTVVQKKCAGIKGKKREWCIGHQKKKCLANGGYWDKSKGKEEVDSGKYTIVQDWDGKEVDVPGSAVDDTSQNCVYFYDSGDWELSGEAPTNRGEWCVDRDGSMSNPLAIWHLKNKSGDRVDGYGFGDKMDFMRIGRNVKVTVYDNFNNGVGTKERVYRGDDPTREGKLLIAGHKRNTVSGFKAESISR